MRPEIHRFGQIPPLVVIVSLLGGIAYADTLLTAEGRTVQGTLLGYGAGVFRFQMGQQVLAYSPDEVRAVTVEGGAGPAVSDAMYQDLMRSLAGIQQQLAQLQAQVNQLALAQSSQLQDVQQRVFELNPLSRVTVEEQRGDYTRDGSFRVTGYLRNQSGVVVFNPYVRVDLVLSDGSLVGTQTFPLATTAIGPNSRAPFRVEFRNAPRFDSYQVTPDLEYSRNPGAEAGPYPPLRQQRRD